MEYVGRDHVEALRHHVVTLAAESESLGTMHVFSGFILSFQDDLLWCSAGHCIQEVEKYIDVGDSAFRFNVLSEKKGFGVPFSPADSIRRHLVDANIDFGFILLKELYAAGIVAAGVIPISNDSIGHTSSLEGTFVLIGVPAESVSSGAVTELGKGLRFTPIAVKLTRTPDEPFDGVFRMNFQFERDLYVIEGRPLESVAGMSGSPIFAWVLDKDGQTKHIPVAIQYAWVRSTNTIRATPMLYLKGILNQSLKTSV